MFLKNIGRVFGNGLLFELDDCFSSQGYAVSAGYSNPRSLYNRSGDV